MRSLLAFPALAGLVFLTGCCGGYSVVRTTVLDRAAVQEGGRIENAGASSVLHFTRAGEPLGGCKPGAQYAEDLWIQVPSLQAGQSFTIGAPGVLVEYVRDQGGARIEAKSVTGKVTIGDRNEDRVVVTVAIAITLPSGEIVEIDSDYDFHPPRPGSGAAPGRMAGASCPSRL